MSTSDGKTLFASMEEIAPLMNEIISSGGNFSLTVKGSSMHPFLRDGKDTVFFCSLGERKLRRGDIILFRRAGGKYVMHRLYRINTNGTYDFVGDNQNVVEPGIPAENLAAYVPEVVRNGKRINCEKGFIRFLFTAYMLFRVRFPRFTIRMLRLAAAIKNLIKK